MKVLKDYQITNFAYRELFYFCMQYYDYESEIKEISCSGGGKATRQVMGQATTISDTTSDKTLRIEKLQNKIDLIEKTVKEVTSDYKSLYIPLLRNVTTGVSYDHLRACEIVKECKNDKFNCRNKFYELRRKFYYLLNIRKKVSNS